jgi:hypothetical protein
MKDVVAYYSKQTEPAQAKWQEELMAESKFHLMITKLIENNDQACWRNAL